MLFLRLLIVAVILFGAWWLFLRRLSAPRSWLKCSACRHAVRVDADGAICRYGAKSTFKNKVHIENCPDFEGLGS